VIALTRVTGGSEVYLVDDDEGFLKALSRMLAAEGFHVRSYNSGRALLNDVAPGARGCVVADLAMPEIDGLRLQTALAESGCRMPVVFLTGAGDIPSTVRAMQGGAVDFLEKLAPKEQLLGAIRRAFERDTLETEQRAQQAEREREVLREVVAGQMNKQIAARLGISERTVKMHRTAITHKVGVHSAAQLATLARDAGLFDAATS
jgi:two-component system response regulator FixJ